MAHSNLGKAAGSLLTATEVNRLWADDGSDNFSTDGTLTIGGDAAFDTDTLFVDVSTKRVGMGTTSPDSPLHIAATGAGTKLTIERTDVPQKWTMSIASATDGKGFNLANATSGGTPIFIEAANNNVGLNDTSPLAALSVKQSSTTGAKPVLCINQLDISEEMIEFDTTIGVGNAIEAVGGKTLTTTHFIKVTLPGALTRYIPCGTIA
jgi:hypothetical protein